MRITGSGVTLLTVLLLIGCGGGSGGGGGGGASYTDIDLLTLRADLYADLADGTLDDMVVIDTSHPAQHALGSLPGAVSIPSTELVANGLAAMVYPDSPLVPGPLRGTAIPLDQRLVFYLGGSG